MICNFHVYLRDILKSNKNKSVLENFEKVKMAVLNVLNVLETAAVLATMKVESLVKYDLHLSS